MMSDVSLAEQYYEEGKYLEAFQIYDILLNGDPHNIHILLAKAKCSMSLGLWHDCFDGILKAFESENWNSSFLENFMDSLTEKLSARIELVDEKQAKEFEENLLCKCCCQVFCRPMTLSCGNTYCRQCVLKNSKCLCCNSSVCTVGKLDELSANVVLTNIIQNCFQPKVKAMELRCEGNECFSNGKYDAALQKYTEALQLDPTNHFILGNLSNVYSVLEEYQTALDFAEKACKIIPNWEKGIYRKACALVGLKKYSQAAICYLKVLLIDPHNNVARNSLKKVLVEILTNSDSASRCKSMIDDLATSLDDLIENQEDTKQSYICVDNLQSVLSENLRETDLECSLCCRMFYDPVTCPCGHTFCQWCLNRCLDHKPVCPVCRYLIKEYIYTKKQNVTESIKAICKKYFPDKYEERKKQHEAKMTKLASVASDTDEDIPVFVCLLPIPTVPCYFYIFEPRYRLMIRECMESGSKQFAMCSPSEDNSFSDYGVMLEVEEYTLLSDGTSHVKVVGGRRFKVLSRGKENGYNTAKVEWLKDESFSKEEIDIFSNRQQSIYAKIVDWYSSLSLFTKIRLLTEMGLPLTPPQCDFENVNKRNGPNWIWWTLHLLPMQPSLKLEIISMTDVRQRLDKIEHFFWENT